MNHAAALARHRSLPFGVGLGGVPAQYYCPRTGVTADSVPVVVRRATQRVDAQGYLARRDQINVQQSALPGPPNKGDRLTVGLTIWEVQEWEEAGNGDRWVLYVRRVYS